MKRATCLLLALSAFFCTGFRISDPGFPQDFRVRYHVAMEREDYARVEISVTGYSGRNLGFYFQEGGILGTYDDVSGIFVNHSASDSLGNALPWAWSGTKSISVSCRAKDFIFSYDVDARRLVREDLSGDINQMLGQEAFVLFRQGGIYFTPSVVCMLPDVEPDEISMTTSFPSGTDLFGSMRLLDGIYIAERDMWRDVRNDFAKNFFTGGKAVLQVSETGKTGNAYHFVLFDWQNDYDRWFASELKPAGEQYIDVMELFSQYYADRIGPLEPHTYIIADGIPSGTEQGFPSVSMRENWYNYMQLWPDCSMIPQVAHHILHSYMFMNWCAKVQFASDSFLSEGITTFAEDTVPALLLEDDYYLGRLCALLMLDQRGHDYGIDQNQFHTRYNIPALKTYLLDREIRERSSGESDVLDLLRVLWEDAEADTSAEVVTEQQIEAALASIAGSGSVDAYRRIRDSEGFDIADFAGLRAPFSSYVKRMADEYFWGSEFLFLCYMDVCSTKGDYWPHYSLIEHNTTRDRRDALVPFKSYLKSLGKTEFSEADVLQALARSTGKDHRGFFEFWRGMGFDADPADIPGLGTWDPSPDAPYTTKSIPSMSRVKVERQASR